MCPATFQSQLPWSLHVGQSCSRNHNWNIKYVHQLMWSLLCGKQNSSILTSSFLLPDHDEQTSAWQGIPYPYWSDDTHLNTLFLLQLPVMVNKKLLKIWETCMDVSPQKHIVAFIWLNRGYYTCLNTHAAINLTLISVTFSDNWQAVTYLILIWLTIKV